MYDQFDNEYLMFFLVNHCFKKKKKENDWILVIKL